MKKVTLVLLGMIIIILFSCVSTKTIPYKGLNTIQYNGRSIYEFKNSKIFKTIIYIEGSGLGSVLGIKENGVWKQAHFGYYIVNYLNRDYTIAIPEKLNMQLGVDYSHDTSILTSYTVENLVNSYAKVIDDYLSNNKTQSVSIIAASEGGLLLPKIYSELKNKEKIKNLIVWGAGGLSQYECFKILAESSIEMPKQYREECLKIDDYKQKIDENPYSINDYYLGWPFNRWNSFFNYRPYEYYNEIKIPILFIQGLKDWNSPYESVKYIQNNTSNKNKEFRYYQNMGHVPESKEEIQKLLNEIHNWIDAN